MTKPIAQITEGFAGLFIGLYKWVLATKWRVFATLVLVPIGLILFVIYEQRQRLADSYFSRVDRNAYVAKIDNGKLSSEIPQLLRRSGADGVSVWLVNQDTGHREVIYRVTSTGEDHTFYGMQFPIFSEDQNVLALYASTRGDVRCLEVIPESEFGEYLKQHGEDYVCVVGIPPGGGRLAGVIVASYKTLPPAYGTPRFREYFIYTARNIVKYGG